MSTVNFSIPEDVKQAFNAAFEGENKSAVLTQLMRDAVQRVEEQRRSRAAIERILGRRSGTPQRSAQALERSRKAMRP